MRIIQPLPTIALQIATSRETRHAQVFGREYRGKQKLTNTDVADIRRLATAGESHQDIAERYGITYYYCAAIIIGNARPAIHRLHF